MPSFEQQFLDALPVISAVVGALGRRYHLSRDEHEDFQSVVYERLIDQGYAVLRRFEGRSSLATYLRTVITRQFLDQRVKAWGRWRPSAEAVRLGPTAVALERLLERQHLPLQQAIETMRARDSRLDDATLRDLASSLPHRITGRRLVDDTVLEHAAAADLSPEDTLAMRRTAEAQARKAQVLRELLPSLPARERLLLRLRFEQGMTVAQIARVLGEPQKPLYRQLARLLARLRHALGVHGARALHLHGLGSPSSDEVSRTGRENEPRPSVSEERRPGTSGSVTG